MHQRKNTDLNCFFNTSTTSVWCCERIVIIQYHLISGLAVGYGKKNNEKRSSEKNQKVAVSSARYGIISTS